MGPGLALKVTTKAISRKEQRTELMDQGNSDMLVEMKKPSEEAESRKDRKAVRQ